MAALFDSAKRRLVELKPRLSTTEKPHIAKFAKALIALGNNNGGHLVLRIDMDGGLLPFRKQRVASSDLKDVKLPGTRVLIVENETCHHQLPELPSTVAILGAGFDLGWTESSLFDDKQVGYWGDIDTWGLQFLAQARCKIKHLHALLMIPIYSSRIGSPQCTNLSLQAQIVRLN